MKKKDIIRNILQNESVHISNLSDELYIKYCDLKNRGINGEEWKKRNYDKETWMKFQEQEERDFIAIVE